MILERKYKLITKDRTICEAIEEAHYGFGRPRLPKQGLFRSKEEKALQKDSDERYENAKWIEVFERAKQLYPEIINQPGARRHSLIAVGRTRCGEYHFTLQVNVEVNDPA